MTALLSCILLSGFLDIRGGLTDRGDVFRLVVWNLNVEFLFELHDELNSVQRIGSQIVGEACRQVYFSCINSQLIDDNRRDFFLNIRHCLAVYRGAK